MNDIISRQFATIMKPHAMLKVDMPIDPIIGFNRARERELRDKLGVLRQVSPPLKHKMPDIIQGGSALGRVKRVGSRGRVRGHSQRARALALMGFPDR